MKPITPARRRELDREAERIGKAYDAVEIERLLSVLEKLANEAAGFLALSDIGRHGHTNSRILRDRIEQARDVIADYHQPREAHEQEKKS